jgi:shikimate kinase
MSNAILIGPPGAGKSSVARSLGKLINKPVLDTDLLVEERCGKSISDIFLEDGESFFRREELKVLLEAIQDENSILALGGGSILSEEAREALISSKRPIVFLDVSISNAAPRVGFNKERPLLTINPRQQWLGLMETRRPIYESLATITLNTDNRKPVEVAQELAQKLELLT